MTAAISVATDPSRNALVIVDLQNDFCAPDGFLARERGYDVGFAGDVAERIDAVARAARRAGTLVVWLRSHYDFKYLNAAEIAKRGREGCCLENSWGADFFGFGPVAGDLVVDKHHFSGFHGTELDDLLQARGVSTLIVTGVATNVCVDSTLRDGFFRGYHIVLLEDCVGSNNAAGHAGTLATVRANIGVVVASNEMIAALA